MYIENSSTECHREYHGPSLFTPHNGAYLVPCRRMPHHVRYHWTPGIRGYGQPMSGAALSATPPTVSRRCLPPVGAPLVLARAVDHLAPLDHTPQHHLR